MRLRNEGDKCTIYRVDDYFHSVDNVTIITSKEAVLLALFDGENDFSEVSRIFFYVLDQDKPEEERNAQVSKIIDNLSVREKEPVLIEKAQANGVIRRYEPEDFVIPASKEKSCPMDMRISAPLSVNFNVATTCGFKCLYCYHPLNPVMPYLPLERVDSLVKELKDSGCESIMLTGGDPCIRPDFIEIMKILHKYDLFYSISTKSILSREQIRRMVEECGLDRIQLSLDSNKPEIVAKLLGCSVDYLRRFEEMVDIFHEYGVEVRIKAVLTSMNAEGLGEFLEYAYLRIGARNIQVVQYGRSGTRHQDFLFCNDLQFQKASEDFSKFRNAHPDCTLQGGGFSQGFDEPVDREECSGDKFFSKRSICNAGRFSMTIMPNGEVFVCEQLPYRKEYVIGDLSTQSLKECWNGEGIKKWLSPPDRDVFPEDSPCRACPDEKYNVCHKVYSRCLRFIWETTKRTDGPDIRCPEARFEKRRIV